MPLTPFQEQVATLLSSNRTYDCYLAGGAAIHLEPNTTRYSNALDLYYSRALGRFVAPSTPGADDAVPHFGRPGGILPRVVDE